MNTIIRGAAAAFLTLGLSFSASSHAAVIHFDDITTLQVADLGLTIPGGLYSGFNWSSNTGVVRDDNTLLDPGHGYVNAATSGHYVAFNLGGTALTVQNAGGFTFEGANITAAWVDGLHLDVKGFSAGVEQFSSTVDLSLAGPTWFSFNYTGIDELVFNGFNGGNTQTQFAIDDFTVSSFVPQVVVVPVPAALWLFASGLLALLGWRRRTA